MFVLKTSSPRILRWAPKNVPRTDVPSSRTRDPSISLAPPPIFDSAYEGFPLAKILARISHLWRPRKIEMVQSLDHLVPVTSPPVDSAAGGTAPKRPVSGADPFGHQSFDVFDGYAYENLVAEGATGQRIDEPQRKGHRDLTDLFFQDVRTDLDSPGDSGR